MAVVRVSASEISACGGTLNDFIGGQLEALRTEPMDVKERAAAVLHALAEQGAENAISIYKLNGLKALIKLADVGSHNAMSSAAAACAVIISTKSEYATEAAKLGGIPPLAKVLRSATGGAQEAAAGAIASISAAAENVQDVIKAGVSRSYRTLMTVIFPACQNDATGSSHTHTGHRSSRDAPEAG